jgi:hypothetical protein
MTQAVQALHPVLLVVFDVPMPEPLFATHPIEGGGAIGLVLDARPGDGPVMTLSLSRKAGGGNFAADADDGAFADSVVGRSLDGLRRMHPVGSALPLLAPLAGGDGARNSGKCHLDLDHYHVLDVAIET